MFNRLRKWISGDQAAGDSGQRVIYLQVPPPRDRVEASPELPPEPQQALGDTSLRNDGRGVAVGHRHAHPQGSEHVTQSNQVRSDLTHSVRETLSQPERRCLRRVGFRNSADVVTASPKRIQRLLGDLSEVSAGDARRAAKLIRRTRWAVTFSSRFSDMTLRQALMLRAVHRGNRASLAAEQPGLLRRDLQRLAYSSRGSRWLGLEELPPIELIKNWIGQARGVSNETTGRRDVAATVR